MNTQEQNNTVLFDTAWLLMANQPAKTSSNVFSNILFMSFKGLFINIQRIQILAIASLQLRLTSPFCTGC